ncbi:hypothetical protein AMELA_G00296730 [Ameiurus melas]|uniref:Immunoglobulin C1-set domain-containing protein n=1 Tax=Ameiurus melas TaxID=219545 RepID=A0A7J5ZI53_AMEME|nr:hypothetical protein AMELA_G00296730 [Ameiurus melas]
MNQDPANSLNVYLFTFCQDYADRYSSKVLKTMKPKVMMRSHAVSWLRNGEVVTEGVSSTDELSDGDWFYQIHTYLEYTPRPGREHLRMVQHEILTQPLISTWDPALPVDERNKLIIGIFFLVLGIVSAVAGFLYYMLRCKRRPATQTSRQTSMRLVSTVSVASSEASNP